MTFSCKPSVAAGVSAVWAPFTPQIFTDSVPSSGPGAKALGSGPGFVHYSCLSRASRPWMQGGEAEEAGAWLTLRGGWDVLNSSPAC